MEQISTLLQQIRLTTGKHKRRGAEMCVMECVAFVTGDAHSDRPECACPIVTVVAAFANDRYLGSCGTELAQRILRLAGSPATREVTLQRSYYLTDFLLRTVVPNALESSLPALAREFRALAPLTRMEDIETVKALVATLPPSARIGTIYDGTWLEMRLLRILVALKDGKFPQGLSTQITGLIDVLGEPIEPVGLLDALLAMGPAPEITVTPELAKRIEHLVETTLPVPA